MHNIPVHIDAIEKRKRSTGPLHLLAGFFLLANGAAVLNASSSSVFLTVVVFGVAALSLLYGVFRKRIDAAALYNHWLRVAQFLTFVALAVQMMDVWSSLKIYTLILWAIVILFLMFTERKVFHDTYVTIKEEGLYIPGYFASRLIPWAVINHVVVRHDFITITKKDNKYLQLEIVKAISDEERQAVTHFIAQRLPAHSETPLFT